MQYDLLPSDNVEEKLNLILSSQEEYDGIQILSKYREKFVDYAKQGALTELDELAEKYEMCIRDRYYIKWRSMLNSEGKYLYEKIIFDGAISGVNSSEMSVTTMVSGTSDYGQLVLKTPKSGVETGYRFTSADRLQFKRYYDYVLRIDTAEKDSDDKISLKVYPAGMADKSIWQLDVYKRQVYMWETETLFTYGVDRLKKLRLITL